MVPVPTPAPRRAPEAAGTLEHAQDELRELRAVLDHVPAMIGYWDRDLRNVVANRAYVEWFGSTPDHIADRHIRDLLGDDLFAQNEPYMRAALAGQQQHFDRTIVDVQGVTRYSQASYIPDTDEQGVTHGFFVLVTDVSARVRAELALVEAERRAARLADQLRLVSRVSAELHDLDAGRVRDAVADALMELGYAGSSLALVDRTRQEQAPSNGRGILAPLNGVQLQLQSGVSPRALRADGPIVTDDYQQDPAQLPEVVATGVRTLVSVPVRSAGEVIAVMHAGYAEVTPVTEADKEALSLLADITGAALANARRYAHAEASLQRTAEVAQTDALTGLGNRRWAERLLESLTPDDVLIVLDLDHFKAVNDQHGHAVGDDVLRAFGRLLAAELRSSDQAARLGGEEFLVLLPQTSLETADEVLLRLRRSWADRSPMTTFSAGGARVRLDEASRSAYERADAALYLAKAEGRDRHVLRA